ncbi:hypothetical protein [uncultured Flavobacterium sp.]|uniref:hypothetical protein n=1 Tax=uncultured Flavobacterium sp. TaxID=165435 RepID=UPI002611991F|nr:hypothetical protein [uncultured Flavobacterium sp.]
MNEIKATNYLNNVIFPDFVKIVSFNEFTKCFSKFNFSNSKLFSNNLENLILLIYFDFNIEISDEYNFSNKFLCKVLPFDYLLLKRELKYLKLDDYTISELIEKLAVENAIYFRYSIFEKNIIVDDKKKYYESFADFLVNGHYSVDLRLDI